MAAVYRVAVIGDWDSVMGFRALGLDTYAVTSPEEAGRTIDRLAKEECAVIYLTEPLAEKLEELLRRYQEKLTPAIVLIPGSGGSLGLGAAAVQEEVRRAVGTDIA